MLRPDFQSKTAKSHQICICQQAARTMLATGKCSPLLKQNTNANQILNIRETLRIVEANKPALSQLTNSISLQPNCKNFIQPDSALLQNYQLHIAPLQKLESGGSSSISKQPKSMYPETASREVHQKANANEKVKNPAPSLSETCGLEAS